MLSHSNIAPKVPWIARYIWLAIMTLGTAFAMNLGVDARQKTLLMLITLMYAVIIVAAQYWRQRVVKLCLFVSFAVDLLVWSAFMYFSGGAANPLITIFLTVVGAATIVLNAKQSMYLSIMAIVSYAALWFFHEPFSSHHHDAMSIATSASIASSLTMGTLHLLGMFAVFVVALVMMTALTIYFKQAMNRTFQALEQAQQAIHQQRRLLAVSSLAANVAHEMSTPIASMQLLTDDIAEQLDDDDALMEDVTLLQSQIDVCRHSLNTLKTHIQATQLDNEQPLPTVHLTNCQLDTLLPRVINDWCFINPHVHINFTPLSTACCVRLNEEQLYSILINIFNNAMQAGATQITVTVVKENKALVIIEDNGHGIDKAIIDSINHHTFITSPTGWGLGLTLAKTVLEYAGGELVITPIYTDNQTKGTRITLYLMLAD